MNDDLKTSLREVLHQLVVEVYGARENEGHYSYDGLDKYLTLIDQAYKEEQHTNALIWYTRLTNDLINDDDLKRTEHVGRILEYARVAAGLTEEDVRIVLPDEYIPHDPDFVAEHISPVVEVSDKPLFEEGTILDNPDGSKSRVVDVEGPTFGLEKVEDEDE